MLYSKDEVKTFIREYRRKSLVDFMLADVNFTKRERQVLDECVRYDRPQQEVADELGRDRCTIQRLQDAALQKIILAWGDDDIVKKLMS